MTSSPDALQRRVWLEELVTRAVAGADIDTLARDLDWPITKVRALTRTPEFLAAINKLAPALAPLWDEEAGRSELVDAKTWALKELPGLLEILLTLAKHGSNETIRLRAVEDLVQITGIAKLQAEPEQGFAMSPAQLKALEMASVALGPRDK